MELKTVRSNRWGYVRIIAGTIAGGILGFYFMHRAETSYKAKWDEEVKKYEEEKMRKKQEQEQVQVDDTLLFADSFPPSQQQQSN